VTAGPAYPVHWWPAARLAARQGVAVIGIAVDGDRAVARQRIRMALREALARLCGVPEAGIAIESAPGQAPRARFASGAQASLAISHEAGYSVAAIHLQGRVGIDLMRVQELPDWRAVAHDYLGRETAARLAALAPARRAAAFAQAWTEREACLKCRGLPLSEWPPDLAARGAACRAFALTLPEGLAGTLAVL
jgi:4'-phosphopantetheinyl transferase